MFNFKAEYNRDKFVSFLSKDFLPEDFNAKEENLSLDFANKYASAAIRLGKCPSLDLEVFEITHKSTHDARVGISRDAFQLLLRKSYCNRALVAFVPEGSKNYRFSLLQIEAEQKEQSSRITRNYSNPRRYSYFLGEDAHTKTPEQFLREKGRIKLKDGDYFKDLLDRFSVEVLTKQFYNELSNWYFWAIKNVSFPNDINDDSDDEKYNTENVIRLITRLIFTWFLKQKKLINPDLFNPEALSGILTNFKPESEKQTNYYRAVLQNLFFATLNQEIGKRGFAEDKGFLENRGTNEIKNLYRFEKEFSGDTKQIMQLFSQVPFLNGGLFECLDDKKKDGKTFYWDGFSRNPKRQANIPNSLFFAKEQIVDISKEYNNKKMQAVKVSGIIEILNRYNFTVEENTPVEIEVALDPELLGKVFENLLGAFNPETQETARKQTGSFYTPREIVSYMVNESLIAYFKTNVPELSEETIRSLFSYEEQTIEIAEPEREAIIQAAFNCKILDPACGSGAFPMGILQQMVHILSKLDPCNTHWNKVVLAQAMKEFDNAEKQIGDDREELRAEIESTFDRSVNYPDYARKLHLIENCIYGVDIQSIAVQISKLRFFISLICEQKRNEDPTENFGIRPLPNLETKFVAANTLIGIEKAEQDMELFEDDHIKKLINNLQLIRHRQFLVTNASQKKSLREKDELLRHEIVNEVQRLYVKHADENLSKYKMQKKVAEKELEQLVAAPDDIRTSVSSDLFGTEKAETFNYSEKRRKELKTNIKRLNDQIEIGSDYSRLNSVVRLAEQLTSWNPYDQNESSSFFDPEWMFGLSKENGHLNTPNSFDIIVGNPPYIKEYTDKSAFNGIRTSPYYQGKMDLWYMFACTGIDLLKLNGNLCFIATNNWVTNGGASKMRKKVLTDSKIIQLVDFGNFMIFESASIQTMVMLFSKNFSEDNYNFDYRKLRGDTTINDATDLLRKRANDKAAYLKPTIIRGQLQDSLLTFNTDNNSFILDKILDNSTFFTEKEVAQGIVFPQDFLNKKNQAKLGDNFFVGEGIFALTETEKENLCLSSEELDIIKPYFTTEQVKRYYTYPENNLWVIYTDSRFKNPNSLNEYPNLKKHLDRFSKIITSDNKPYGLHRAREERFFQGEKILVQRKCVGRPSFSYANFDCYVSATFYVIKTNRFNYKYLLGLLNSKLIKFWLQNKGKMQGDNFQLDKEPLLNIPIRIPTNEQQTNLIELVDEILSKKNEKNYNSQTEVIENGIDKLVFEIYGLSEEDIRLIHA